MATVTASDFPALREPSRSGAFQRFYAAIVDARMRKAERIVSRARRSMHERGVIVAELAEIAPPRTGTLPLGS